MLIQNGTIIDGTGKPRYKADIRIERDKIKDIGKLAPQKNEKVIDALGKFVAPGFVDILNRSDIHFSLFEDGGLRSLVRQGITTIVGGGCGASLAPIITKDSLKPIQKWENLSRINANWSGTDEYLLEVERHKPSVNFATLTGYSTIRRGLFGEHFEKISDDGLKKVACLLEKSIKDGSFGLSLGLAYSHERIADEREIECLARVVKAQMGFVAVHLRDEGKDLLSSLEEVLNIGSKYKISIHIYHVKAFGREAWHLFPKALDEIEKAQDTGIKVTFDVYPYTTTESVLYLLLPHWMSHGGRRELLNRLHDQVSRKKTREEMEIHKEELLDIIIARGNIDQNFIGKSLREIARNQGVSVADALMNTISVSGDQVVGFMSFINDQNLESAIVSKAGIISSDGAGYRTLEGKSGMLIHPRSFGAFPRFLKYYVRERSVLSWEEAVHKITLAPAEKIGLEKRGKIEAGNYADIIVFDPERLRDNATFKNPFQYAEGIDYVLVNGGFALKRGRFQKGRWGRVLRK